jgi:hypothetical protein
MKNRTVMTVLGTAAITTAVTLGLASLWAGGRADAGPLAVKPVIARPEFTSQGCKFVLKADKAAYEPEDSPVFEISATNTTGADVKAKVWINVLATAPSNPMSRMMPRPRSLWSQVVAFNLEPGESRTQKVTCEAKLPAGQSVSITLGDKQESIMPMNLPVTNGTNAVPVGGSNMAPAARRPYGDPS